MHGEKLPCNIHQRGSMASDKTGHSGQRDDLFVHCRLMLSFERESCVWVIFIGCFQKQQFISFVNRKANNLLRKMPFWNLCLHVLLWTIWLERNWQLTIISTSYQSKLILSSPFVLTLTRNPYKNMNHL